jgi:hypothetical protein
MQISLPDLAFKPFAATRRADSDQRGGAAGPTEGVGGQACGSGIVLRVAFGDLYNKACAMLIGKQNK